jgi:hypothetical protein
MNQNLKKINMPYTSDQQRKWAHTEAGMKALGGPSKVAEWDAASKGMKLPKKVGKLQSMKKRKMG